MFLYFGFCKLLFVYVVVLLEDLCVFSMYDVNENDGYECLLKYHELLYKYYVMYTIKHTKPTM